VAVEIVQLSARELLAVQSRIVGIYAAAFAEPPYLRGEGEARQFGDTLGRHAQRRDFRSFVALDRADGRLLGFVYGYTSEAGQWWHDIVAGAMTREQVGRWLTDAYEFVELAVLPEEQKHGFGGRLHDAVLEGLPHRVSVLSTLQTETDALHLYYKRGWVDLVQNLVFPAGGQPYRIMGIDLAARRP
jgi:GNAT superfamily N-acetyltransferase